MIHLTTASHQDYRSPALETNSAGLGGPIVCGELPQCNNAAFFAPGAPSMGGLGRRPQGLPVHTRSANLSSSAHPAWRRVAVLNRSVVCIMTNQLSVFNFNTSNVRAVVVNNEPWFVCSDVAEALGYRDSHNAARCLDDDEKGTHNLSTPGGSQQVTIINESGLYALVLRSRKPEARKFAKWVTSEVLPAIRKTGAYATVTVNAEKEQKKITPPKISEYLQLHINRKTHEIALGQYDAIRGIITEAVQSNLNSAGQALETIHHIEKHIGQELYSRKQPDKYCCYGFPEYLVESVISAAQERKAA